MSDVLAGMALAGLGVAWLTASTRSRFAPDLVEAAPAGWSLPLSVVAFKARHQRKRSVNDTWHRITAMTDLSRTEQTRTERTRAGRITRGVTD